MRSLDYMLTLKNPLFISFIVSTYRSIKEITIGITCQAIIESSQWEN